MRNFYVQGTVAVKDFASVVLLMIQGNEKVNKSAVVNKAFEIAATLAGNRPKTNKEALSILHTVGIKATTGRRGCRQLMKSITSEEESMDTIDNVDTTISEDVEQEEVANLTGREALRRFLITKTGKVLRHPELPLGELLTRYPDHRVFSIPASVVKELGFSFIKTLVKENEEKIFHCKGRDVSSILLSPHVYAVVKYLQGKI